MQSRVSPLRVAVLCSRRAPALRHLLRHDSERGRSYDVVACVTTEDHCEDADLAREYGVPVLTRPLRAFTYARGWRLSDPRGRAAYDAATEERLSVYRPDLLLLDAYLYLLTEPMLWPYRGRIINLHHSDLTIRDEHGRAALTGLRAVYHAIAGGAAETCATAHLVTPELDQGPAFLRSWAFPVAPLVADARAWRATDIVKAYAYAHQEWMIRATWGPLAAASIALIAGGQLDLAVLGNQSGPPGAPWDLDQEGGVHGQGPLPPGRAAARADAGRVQSSKFKVQSPDSGVAKAS